MANTFAPTAGRVTPIARNVGHAKLIYTTSDSYSSGITVDFFAPFSDLGINASDVMEITGYTELGYFARFTKGTLTSSAYPWVATLWSGTTQHAAAAVVGNLHINVIFYPGAK